MSARLFPFHRFLAWLTALVFLGGSATVPVLDLGTVLHSRGDASISAIDQTTHFVAAHTFVAKSPVVFRAWRSVDARFSTADNATLRAVPFGQPVSTTVKVAEHRPAGTALVGIIELRI